MKKLLGLFAASVAAALLGTTSANALVALYNGLLTPSQTPSQQGWLYKNTTFSIAPTETPTTSGTVLNSGNKLNYAGYFKQLSTTPLDRNTGYSIEFTVKVNSESHSNNNRAGFNIIVMSDAVTGVQPHGIELGFWTNSIWAQNVGFTRGENITFNTNTSSVKYRLSVQGLNYELYAGTLIKPILKGQLRQYTGFTPPSGYPNPYKMPNLIFMGDNTTSARGNVMIAKVNLL